MWLQFLVSILLIWECSGRYNSPLAYWSMDRFRGSTLLPDIGDEQRYSCDMSRLSSTKYKIPGVVGNAIKLKRKSVDLAENIGRKDCIRNPVKCTDGLSVAFWVNIEEYTYKKYQVIARTTTVTKSLAGYFIGGDDSDQDSMLFLVRTAEGKQYQATIPRSVSLGKWTMLGFTWSEANGLEVFVNGKKLTDSQYISPPTVQDAGKTYPLLVDMVVGNSLGPIFSLDEFRVYNESVTEKDMAELYALGAPAETTEIVEPVPPSTTTAKSTTTTTKTTTPTEKPTTTTTTTTPTTIPSTTLPQPTTPITPIPDGTTYGNATWLSFNSSTESPVVAPEPTEPPNGVFTMLDGLTPMHQQLWFHIALIVTVLLLIGFVVGMLVVYCCCKDSDGKAPEAQQYPQEDPDSKEPFVEKDVEQPPCDEWGRVATTVT